MSAVLAALVVGVGQIDTEHWTASLLSLRVWPWLLLLAVGIPLLWSVEKRAADPVLPPALLHSAQLKLVAAIALAAGAVEAGMVFLPDVAVIGLGVKTANASVMMLPLVLTLAIGAPLAGRLLDRIGARTVVQGGGLANPLVGTTKGVEMRFHPKFPAQEPNALWTFDGTIPPKLLRERSRYLSAS